MAVPRWRRMRHAWPSLLLTGALLGMVLPGAAAQNLAATPPAATRHFRLWHSNAPCPRAPCADWTVTDLASGGTFTALVDPSTLQLPADLRQGVLQGRTDLLVTGQVAHRRAGTLPYVAVQVRSVEGFQPHPGR